jgi:hypothetical protein
MLQFINCFRNISIYALAALSLCSVAVAQRPIIPYQGVLTRADGTPVSGTVNVSLQLFSDSIGTNRIGNGWGPLTYSLKGGLFFALLYDFPVGAAQSSPTGLWLEVEAEGAGLPRQAFPRVQIVGAPYALNVTDNAITSSKIADGAVTAAKLDRMGAQTGQVLRYTGTAWAPQTLTGEGGVPNDNTVSTVKIQDGAVTAAKLALNSVITEKIQNGAVTAEKLAPNAAVLSLNGLTGNVSLAGAGVNVSQAGQTITITANAASDIVPIGTIVAYYAEVTPTKTLPAGWLLCDGEAIPAENAALKALLNSAKTPDLRGMFLRGANANVFTQPRTDTLRDYDEASRFVPGNGQPGSTTGQKIGSVQGNAFKSHNHTGDAAGDAPEGRHGLIQRSVLGTPYTINANGRDSSGSGQQPDLNNTPRSIPYEGRLETRPNNVYINWIIKAR